VNLVFSSKALKQCRPALEDLLFFNPRQFRVRDGIINSLQQFGHPRLEEAEDSLSIQVGDKEAQTLFAYDRDSRSNDPVGLVVFLRTTSAEIAIIHVAVHADYALQGRHGGLGLGTILVEKVKEIASRIVGVQRIVFFYRQEVVIRL
jgi:ribosomal protein S18 acetylase RimI-like enzyme